MAGYTQWRKNPAPSAAVTNDSGSWPVDGETFVRFLGFALTFCLICGMAGVAAFVLLWRLGVDQLSAQTRLAGCRGRHLRPDGGVCGAPAELRRAVLVARRSVSLRVLFGIAVGPAAFTVYTRRLNAGGEVAHLAGAVAGAVLVRDLQRAGRFRPDGSRQHFWRPGDPASNFFRRD